MLGFKSKNLLYLVLPACSLFLVPRGYCDEGKAGVFPKERHNSFVEAAKVVGGAFLIFAGSSVLILADSPQCDKDAPIPGPCIDGEPHPTRNKIVGGSVLAGGVGLAAWGILNLADNIKHDNYPDR